MGSDSDWKVMEAAASALDEFGIGYEVDVVSAQDEHSIPVRLSFVEELGSDAYIYGELVGAEDSEAKLGSGEDSSQIIVRVPPRTAPEPGETVYVRIRPGQEHIFSASTGKRLPA